MLRVTEEFIRSRLLQDDPKIDEDHPVGYLAGKPHFVGDNDEGHSRMGETLHDEEHLADHLRIEGRMSAHRRA